VYKINNIKKIIRKNDKDEDKEFHRICKWMNIDPNGNDGEAVWDHIYNGSDWRIEYK
jgi:hypothetical protein